MVGNIISGFLNVLHFTFKVRKVAILFLPTVRLGDVAAFENRQPVTAVKFI